MKHQPINKMTKNLVLVAICIAVLCTNKLHGFTKHRMRRELEGCAPEDIQNQAEFELCEFRWLGLLTKEGELVPVEQMGVNLDHTFGEQIRDNGDLVAKAIHERCGGNEISIQSRSQFRACVLEILKIGRIGILSKLNEQIYLKADVQSKETAEDYPPVEMIYPNLTCHPNYNANRKDKSKGEGYLREGYKFCKYMKNGGPKQPPECLKICMAEYVGLLDTRWRNDIRVQWNSFSEMVNNVRHLLTGFNTKSGQKIVRTILDKCGNRIKLVERTRTNPCHTTRWRDFFRCLDSVWDCGSMTGAPLLDY